MALTVYPPEEGEYRLYLIHYTGCCEWDDVAVEDDLQECLEKLKRVVATDVLHYQKTGNLY